MRNLQCFVLFLFVTVVLSVNEDYCNLKSCKDINRTQTLCLYPDPNPGEKCGKEVKTFGPTQKEKDMIVNTHNKMRQYVAAGKEQLGSNGPQPKATDMKMMKWDNELEKVAQRWANQCKFGHDSCRNVKNLIVGQNAGLVKTNGPDTIVPDNVIQAWYNEVKDFNRSDIAPFRFTPGTGHYTQLVWASSSLIGCGSIRYRLDGWNSYYLVCNYGPSGNWIGGTMYKTP